MMTWLNGKKTYLGMIGLGILGILWSQGIVEEKLAQMIGSVLGAWTGVAVKHAWSKGK